MNVLILFLSISLFLLLVNCSTTNLTCSFKPTNHTRLNLSLNRCAINSEFKILDKNTYVNITLLNTTKNLKENLKENHVEWFDSNNKAVMNYFPKNFGESFKDLIVLRIEKAKLQEVHHTDLSPFNKLKVLNLNGNKLQSIDSNLFDHNLDLEYIYLKSNKISFVGTDSLKKLNFLKEISLQNNNCTSATAESKDQLAIMLRVVEEQCKNENPVEIQSVDESNNSKKLKSLIETEKILSDEFKAFRNISKVEISLLKQENQELKNKNIKSDKKIQKLQKEVDELKQENEKQFKEISNRFDQIKMDTNKVIEQKIISELNKIYEILKIHAKKFDESVSNQTKIKEDNNSLIQQVKDNFSSSLKNVESKFDKMNETDMKNVQKQIQELSTAVSKIFIDEKSQNQLRNIPLFKEDANNTKSTLWTYLLKVFNVTSQQNTNVLQLQTNVESINKELWKKGNETSRINSKFLSLSDSVIHLNATLTNSTKESDETNLILRYAKENLMFIIFILQVLIITYLSVKCMRKLLSKGNKMVEKESPYYEMSNFNASNASTNALRSQEYPMDVGNLYSSPLDTTDDTYEELPINNSRLYEELPVNSSELYQELRFCQNNLNKLDQNFSEIPGASGISRNVQGNNESDYQEVMHSGNNPSNYEELDVVRREIKNNFPLYAVVDKSKKFQRNIQP